MKLGGTLLQPTIARLARTPYSGSTAGDDLVRMTDDLEERHLHVC